MAKDKVLENTMRKETNKYSQTGQRQKETQKRQFYIHTHTHTHTHVYSFFHVILHHVPSQGIRYNSLGYTADSHI